MVAIVTASSLSTIFKLVVKEKKLVESAFAPYVSFGVLMTSKLRTNVILMRYVAAISPMKDSKS